MAVMIALIYWLLEAASTRRLARRLGLQSVEQMIGVSCERRGTTRRAVWEVPEIRLPQSWAGQAPFLGQG
jgi:hypothetical protein